MSAIETETEVPRQYLAYSQLTVHRQCPQRWMYAHDRKLEKVDPEDARVELEMGQWWHALRAADSIERGLVHGTLQSIPRRISTTDDGPEIKLPSLENLRAEHEHSGVHLVRQVLEAADQWWKSRSGYEVDAWEERIGADMPSNLRRMSAAWKERWSDELAYERPLAVELYWRRDLPTLTDRSTGEIRDTHTTMTGYVDEVYLDIRRNLVVARDHKAHKKLSEQSAADDMMDSQLQIYAWGASPTVSSWGLGPIRATAYDRVRTTVPKSPTVTASGTLSKSVTDYDLATYLAFAAGPDGDGVPWGEEGVYFKTGKRAGEPKFGRYTAEESVIEKLSDPAALSAWQQRTLTPLNRNIVRTHLRAAVDTAGDIRVTRDRAAETREAGRNLSKGCEWCPFAALCRAEMVGGPDGDYDLEAMFIRPKRRRGRGDRAAAAVGAVTA